MVRPKDGCSRNCFSFLLRLELLCAIKGVAYSCASGDDLHRVNFRARAIGYKHIAQQAKDKKKRKQMNSVTTTNEAKLSIDSQDNQILWQT